MPPERILSADGTCKACSVKTDASIQCFTCEDKWHVQDCTGGEDLVTATFDKQWKAWRAAGTYKCITFICPPCRNAKNLSREINASNRMSVMEERVSTVQEDIATIKNLLLNGSTEFPNLATANPAVSYAQQVAHHPVKPSDSVLVIKNKENEVINKDIIKEAAVNSRVGINSTYNNKAGDTVIICESEAGKQRLTANLREKVKDRDIITPAQRTPTIRVTGMIEKYDTKTVFELAKELNADKGVLIDDQNFKVFNIRPHAKNDKLFQATVRVSNEIRQAIDNAGNKIHVGLTICHVYDHFHVKRCNKCQGFNHYKDKCGNDPICGKCAGSHDTEGCNVEQFKCANCSKNKYDETNHKTSDPNCKSYVAAQNKIEQSIGFYKKKN